MKDYKREYNLELKNTRLMLSNIKSLKVDVTDLSNELDSLISNPVSNNFGFAFMKDFDYKNKLEYLKKFQDKLKNFETLFKINNSSIYLSEFISKDMTPLSVSKSAKEILTSLRELKDLDSNLSESMSDVVNLLLDTAYSVIKLEFIYLNKSDVLDYIVSDGYYISDINSRILSEVEEIRKSINAVNGIEDLEAILFERGKMGINTHYVSSEVFKVLVVATDYDKLKNHIQDVINDFSKRVNTNLNKISSFQNEQKSLEKEISDVKRDKYWSFRDIRKKVLAIILSSTILGTGTYFLFKANKNGNTYNKYLTHTTTITKDNEDDVQSEYLKKLEKEYQVKLEVSNIYKSGFFNDSLRTEIYDVTEMYPEGTLEYNFDDFSFLKQMDYLDSWEEELKVRLTDEEKEDLEKVYKFIVINQNLESFNVEFDQEGYKALCVLILFVDVLIGGYLFRKFDIKYLPENMKEYLSNGKKLKIKEKKLRELIINILSEINSNEELKNDFIKFCKDNELIIKEHFNDVNTSISSAFKKSDNYVLELNKKLKVNYKVL